MYEFKGRLLPYQHEGVRWLYSRERSQDSIVGGCLFDEMGLGKTVQMLCLMALNRVPMTLLVVPKSLLLQWEIEAKRFFPDLNVIQASNEIDEDSLRVCNLVVTTYGKIASNKFVFTQYSWDRIIYDEAHILKNSKSKRHISAEEIRGKIKWFLTGTPVPNFIKDFISITKLLGVPKYMVMCKRDDVISKYVLRRTRSDVSEKCERLELPPCRIENIDVELCDEELQCYELIFERCKEKISKWKSSGFIKNHIMEILEMLLRCRQALICTELVDDCFSSKSSKIEWIEKKIIEIQKVDEKSLIFCHFRKEMNIIHDTLEKRGVRCVQINGSKSTEERNQHIEEFTTSNCNVMIIQIEAGGVGLNLQSASHVFITSPSWNPSSELQAVGRCYRTGQTKEVNVYRLCASGECQYPLMDHSILELQERKLNCFAELMRDPRILKSLPQQTNSDRPSLSEICKLFMT